MFRRLTEEELRPLLMVAERRWYAKGEIILPRHPEEDSVFVIVKGGVRLYLISPRGRELTLHRQRSGDVFEMAGGGTDLGRRDPEFSVETIAEVLVDHTVIYIVPWLRFLSAAVGRPDAAAALASLLRLRRAEERALVCELAFYGRKERLAHKLAQLAEGGENGIVSETRETLAGMIGTWTEDVTKALHELRDEGLVDFRRHSQRRIVVRDMERLANYRK